MGKEKKINKEVRDKIFELYTKEYIGVIEIGKIVKLGKGKVRQILDEENVHVPKISPYKYEYWMERGMSIDDAKYKSKTFKKGCIEYYLSRGISEEEGRKAINAHLSNNKEDYIKRYGVDSEEKYKELKKQSSKNFTNTRSYWINKGITDENEITRLISENQNKFSKDKLLEKYSENEALEILNKRNELWKKTLEERYPNKQYKNKQDVKSKEYFKEKYPDDWVVKLLEKRFNRDNLYIKGLLEIILKNEFSEDEMIEFLVKNYNDEKRSDFYRLFRLSTTKELLSEYNLNKIFVTCKEKLGLIDGKKSQYGVEKRYGEYIFKSLGEYEIGKFLIDNNIKFNYEVQYPTEVKRFKCDFFIIEDSTYIEYFGLYSANNSIGEKYRNKIIEKHKIVNELNLKFFFSNNIKEIINYLNGYKK